MTEAEKQALWANQELAKRVMADPKHKRKITQDFYSERVEAGDSFGAAVALTLRQITEERGLTEPSAQDVPSWFRIAGFVSGLLTMLFFMCLVAAGILGKPVPQDSRFLVVVVMSIGMALSFGFVGGSAAAAGKIPMLKSNPLTFSACGGFAVFVVVLVLGKNFYA